MPCLRTGRQKLNTTNMDFGSRQNIFSDGQIVSIRETTNVVKFGANYRFNASPEDAGYSSVGSALAADLPVKATIYKAPPRSQVGNWTGWYIGGNAGYGWGSNTGPGIETDPGDVSGIGPYFAVGGNVFPNLAPKGFIGGGQVGYDWQVNRWVFGGIADFQGADITASVQHTITPAAFPITTTQGLSEKLNLLGTLRARVGWASNDWLSYGSGGFAYGNVRSTL